MTDSIPFYIEELVCSLAEHSADDDFIVGVCLSLMGNDRRVAEVLSYLERRKRTHAQILNFISRLTS